MPDGAGRVANRGPPRPCTAFGDVDIDVSALDFDIDVTYDDFTIDVIGGGVTVRIEITSPELLGFALQQGRLVRGASQRQLADQLGIGQKWVWEMENGKPGLLMERLFAMLDATGVRLWAEIDDSAFDAVDAAGGAADGAASEDEERRDG
ncbi:hypothetical protein ABRQ22_00485 [Cellulosimicrobium sp. ES-005]|uniref:HTH cro/C1-type domain-containing protein n=1 Tax=Cellulosimicrobium sp. ES-005 TaxID=3163031 RepID=A0AAU8G3B9_9MICO